MHRLTSGSVLVAVGLVSAGATSSTMVFTVLFSADMIERLWLRSEEEVVKETFVKCVIVWSFNKGALKGLRGKEEAFPRKDLKQDPRKDSSSMKVDAPG